MQLEDGKQSGRAVSICGLEVSTYETLRRAWMLYDLSYGCCIAGAAGDCGCWSPECCSRGLSRPGRCGRLIVCSGSGCVAPQTSQMTLLGGLTSVQRAHAHSSWMREISLMTALPVSVCHNVACLLRVYILLAESATYCSP